MEPGVPSLRADYGVGVNLQISRSERY